MRSLLVRRNLIKGRRRDTDNAKTRKCTRINRPIQGIFSPSSHHTVYNMKIFALFFLVALTACNASNKAHLGKDKIDWQTDHDTALKASTKTGKPVFAFFEGKTSANKTLEKEVLTHPLFIESIHTDFIPLLVKNNSASETQQILTKYCLLYTSPSPRD